MFSCYMIVTHIRHSSYRNRTIIRHRSFIWFCESPEVFKRCLNNSYVIRLNSFSNFVDMKIYIKLNERKKCIMQRMYNFKLYLNALWKNLNAMLCARLHSLMGSWWQRGEKSFHLHWCWRLTFSALIVKDIVLY